MRLMACSAGSRVSGLEFGVRLRAPPTSETARRQQAKILAFFTDSNPGSKLKLIRRSTDRVLSLEVFPFDILGIPPKNSTSFFQKCGKPRCGDRQRTRLWGARLGF